MQFKYHDMKKIDNDLGDTSTKLPFVYPDS